MRPNLAERAGMWSAAHWKAATFGWLAFVAIAIVFGQALGTVKLTDTEQSTGESARAEKALEASGLHRAASESVLVQSPRVSLADPEFKPELAGIVTSLRAMPETKNLRSPLDGDPRQVSRDGHSALVQFDMRGSADTADNRVQPLLDEVASLRRAAPAFTIA